MIKNFLAKRWLIILLIFVVFSLITTFVLRLITPSIPAVPKTEFISTNPAGDVSSFANIRFTGTFAQQINLLPVASIQPSQTTLDYVRNQLIDEYQLDQAVGISGLWRGANYNLTYNDGADEYILYSLFVQEEIILADTNRAIEVAQSFVQKTFPNLELVAQKNDLKYFSGLEELEKTTRNQAVAVEVPFTYTIESIPVYLSHTISPPISVLINSQYEVQKVVFQPNFVDFTPSPQKLPIVGLGVVLDNINNRNEASILSAYTDTGEYFTLEEVRSGELTTVQLEYRADFVSGLAYPFYHFTGELTNQDGQTIQAEIITPAVETQ